MVPFMRHWPYALLTTCAISHVTATSSAVDPLRKNAWNRCRFALSSHRQESSTEKRKRKRSPGRNDAAVAFQRSFPSVSLCEQALGHTPRRMRHGATRLFNDVQNEGSETPPPSFLSTSKANVSFKRRNKNNKSNNQSPSNLSPVDRLLLTLTSDQTSLLLGSIGILLLLLNRWVSFPDDPMYEAGRSRVDLLGVFAAGSVLLNGITKLDIESAKADRVILEGVFGEGEVLWNTDLEQYKQINVSTVEWVLSSFLKCSPARTAVLLTVNTQDNEPRWIPLAMTGVLPIDPELRTLIPKEKKTPILDRMLREDSRHAKGGTVGGTETASAIERRGPKESYLPTLQALPGKVEFTYLPPNAQEALLLPVRRSGDSGDTDQSHDGGGRHYALVLGGDTAKSFAPRDIVWCKEISSWIGCQ